MRLSHYTFLPSSILQALNSSLRILKMFVYWLSHATTILIFEVFWASGESDSEKKTEAEAD